LLGAFFLGDVNCVEATLWKIVLLGEIEVRTSEQAIFQEAALVGAVTECPNRLIAFRADYFRQCFILRFSLPWFGFGEARSERLRFKVHSIQILAFNCFSPRLILLLKHL
jgi:hypothetical protein